jgi:ribosome biogenesis GTPase A
MNVINQKFNELKAQTAVAGQALQKLIKYVEFSEQENILIQVIERLEDPFMFVIVGEVKAGKSSFINALLDPSREICKVAVSPMTDTIQQIVYGDTEREEFLSPFLKRIHQPIDILQEVAIVDTPGTNTIIEHHQEITEKFVPMSDLIIFVFEAKNPYRQSSWDFFDFIKDEWRKKVIFVLQQKDLLSEADLAVNLEGVKQNALKKGMAEPRIFAVSALNEIEGKKEVSGYAALKTFITNNITGGKAPFLKLIGTIETFEKINSNLQSGMDTRRSQFDADVIFREEINLTLDHQEKQTQDQVNLLVENLVARYDQITKNYQLQLHERLGLLTLLKKSFQSIFSKKENLKSWLDGLIMQMDSELKEGMSQRLGQGVQNIAENIQFMAKIVSTKLENNPTILTRNHEIFSELAERRANILKELQDTFANFLKREENIYDKSILQKSSSFSPDFAKGSGIAAIGIILSAVTNGIIFDITGGILTTLGILFAGVSIGIKRKKIERSFENELSAAREKLRSNIDEKMNVYIAGIKQKIIRNFNGFDTYLNRERQEIEKIDKEQLRIKDQFRELKEQISKEV